MTDNFDDMMEYVEGYKPKEGDVFDFIEYKLMKGKIRMQDSCLTWNGQH